MFVQRQLAGAVSARMDCRYRVVGIGNSHYNSRYKQGGEDRIVIER